MRASLWQAQPSTAPLGPAERATRSRPCRGLSCRTVSREVVELPLRLAYVLANQRADLREISLGDAARRRPRPRVRVEVAVETGLLPGIRRAQEPGQFCDLRRVRRADGHAE